MYAGGHRSYQCCQNTGRSNWIWNDRVCEGYVCRKCGQSWSKPANGFSIKKSPSPKRYGQRQRPVAPPPGLGGHRQGRHKATTDLLTASWTSLGSKLQQQVEQLGIRPPAPNPEPDLKDVLQENLSQLPAAVKELVEKITRPPSDTERDMAQKLKAQVSTPRDLSQEAHPPAQAGPGKEDLRGHANSTSAAYMALVNTSKPTEGLHDDSMMEDTVPEAVAGFITTLGVNLTEDQKAQLNTRC